LADDSYSAERFIAALSPAPLLLMHGSADAVVPYSHSERLFAKAAEPKRLVRIEGGAHTEALTPRLGAVYRDLLADFFAAALAAD
ncbi:MAG TPA: alpha/beta hydrolase, partial [Burkholderiales bacterium]|nr:alpha/beta hydrolase [Burkholderiales bacterium]